MVNTTLNANTAVDSKLQEFFISQLQDIYWAEKKLVKTLPKLEEAANAEKLKEAFRNHLYQTEDHVTRLEQVFSSIGEEAKAQKCPAMAGIVDEGEEIIDDTEEGTATRDAALIFAGQKAEHYEIASYGGLAQLARILGYGEAVQLLEATLQEEKDTDALLTQIAENNINERAAEEPK
jgi:ferritin-like metal-binding protein YciE